jgi:hypothetical protein
LASQQKPAPHVPAPPPTVHAAVHVPPEQVGDPPPHFTQVPPVLPHDVSRVPAVHWLSVPSQHPPLHAVCDAPHATSQDPVLVLHDSPGAQSPGWAQPASPRASAAAVSAPVSAAPVSPPEEEPSGEPSLPLDVWSAPVSAPLLPPCTSVVASLPPPPSAMAPEPPEPLHPPPATAATASVASAATTPRRARLIYCQTQPDCVRQAFCVESATHGVTLPVQVDEVDCQ